MSFYLWSNQGMILVIAYASCKNTYLLMTFWILLHIKNNKVALWRTWRLISRRGKLSLRCWAFAWLRKCDEADVTIVQTRKTQSLYYNTRSSDLCIPTTTYNFKVRTAVFAISAAIITLTWKHWIYSTATSIYTWRLWWNKTLEIINPRLFSLPDCVHCYRADHNTQAMK